MSLWFGPLLARGHTDPVSWVLYALLPALAAGAAGAMLGAPLVVPPGPSDAWHAALRGASVALVALVLFAPAYAIVLRMAEPGWTGLAGLTLLVLELGGLTMGWLIVVVGGVVGWGLFRWSRRHQP